MAMAQTQTEQTSSPTMTALTIQWACQNSVNSERSDDVSGSTDCATSAGFFTGTSFPLAPGLNRRGTMLGPNAREGWVPLTRSAEIRKLREYSSRHVRYNEIPAKLGQT